MLQGCHPHLHAQLRLPPSSKGRVVLTQSRDGAWVCARQINNLSYSLMLKEAREEALLPVMGNVVAKLREMAHAMAALPMLSRTHGQAATPSTMGKELANVVARLDKCAQTELRRRRGRGAGGGRDVDCSPTPRTIPPFPAPSPIPPTAVRCALSTCPPPFRPRRQLAAAAKVEILGKIAGAVG